MKFLSRIFLSLILSLPSLALAEIANTWHIPSATQTGLPGTMRSPYVEISQNGTFTVYTGYYKGDGANQTGGTLYYRKGSVGAFLSTGLNFLNNTGSTQFWNADINLAGLNLAPTDVVEYYIRIDSDNRDTTFLYGGDLDGNNQKTTIEAIAQATPYSYRNRPAWIYHNSNRVLNGNQSQFWAKVGYITDPTNAATKWTTNGTLYYTTDGTAPAGSLGVASGTTVAVPFLYDHPEGNAQGGSSSIAGTPMWWRTDFVTLPPLTTIKYRIGFYGAGGEEKFADNNAGPNNVTFQFSIGTIGEPLLTVSTPTTGTLNANYTTSKLFVDEIAGNSIPVTVTFSPGEAATEVEVVTNLNRRKQATADKNANGIDDGMEFNQTEGIIGPDADTSYYYLRKPMPETGNIGEYAVQLNAVKTGAYRLTARWKVAGDPNWRWFTYAPSNRRDHALTVSPIDARSINLYEINTLTIEAKASGNFIDRSTFEDLFDAPNAPRTTEGRGFNLDYLLGLGVNWLWFQPIHPPSVDGREIDPNSIPSGQPYNLGSPYAVKNFFEVNPWMSANYNGTDPINEAFARSQGMVSFQAFVGAADVKGVGVMLDAPFNHSGFDIELAQAGIDYLQPDGATWNSSDQIRNRDARFFSRDDLPADLDNGEDYAQRASSAATIATAPDRGDFGKWNDVKDLFFGRYDALVNMNPQDNGNYLNEGDRFYYTDPTWTSNDFLKGGQPQNMTRQVWKYFARYATYWLDQTGYPANPTGEPINSHAGIDGLRCDFGQGLPPQAWEYMINVARARKWNFVMMSESLDGSAVTYRSNRHFDILNENIVFPLKSAGNSTDYRNIFESRRTAYGQGLVLLNSTSHDEENFTDIYQALIRNYVTNTVDGAPLIFMGQEIGVTRTSGFTFYETNFGKQVAHFKKFNSMQPGWLNRTTNAFGEDFLFDAFGSVGQARLFSPALRGNGRYFLNRKAGGARESMWSVAKYEQANASPAFADVIFAFANLRTATQEIDTFEVNITQSGSNLFGIKSGRTYNVKNIAAYTRYNANARNLWLWGPGRSGTDLLDNGIYVSMNPLPNSNLLWQTAPFEAQYLKLYDVTAPPQTNQPANQTLKAYAIGNQVVFTWTPNNGPDDNVPSYRVNIGTTPGGNDVINNAIVTNGSNSYTVTSTLGQTLYATVTPVSAAGTSGVASAASTSVILLTPTGDQDNDGQSNESEDFAGTDPLSNASALRITSTEKTGNTTTITWQSVTGKQYQVWHSADLVTPFAPLSGTLTAVAASTSYQHTPSTADKGFYRVKVVP